MLSSSGISASILGLSAGKLSIAISLELGIIHAFFTKFKFIRWRSVNWGTGLGDYIVVFDVFFWFIKWLEWLD